MGGTLARRRWVRHRCHLNQGVHQNRLLQEDWDTYGETAFEFTVIEQVDETRYDTRARELAAIWERRRAGVVLYNATKGDLGW